MMKTVSVNFTRTRETDKTGPARRYIWFGSDKFSTTIRRIWFMEQKIIY